MRSPRGSQDVDAVCDCIVFRVRAVGAGAPGLPGGGERKDQGGGEGIETGLLRCGDVPPPLLLVLNEPAVEKHTASMLPRGKRDAAAGEAPPCALPVSAAKERRDPSDPGCCVPQA